MNSARLKFLVCLTPLLLSGCLTGGSSGPFSSPPKPAPVVRGMQGGLAGVRVGKDLSSADLRSALDAEYRALENTPGGQAVSWKGDDASGQVVAAQPYRVGSQDCRQYAQTVLADGESESARGTACRNTNGTWTLLD